jgi:heat shock protein HtpX
MMLVSFLPSLFYLIGRSAMFSAYYGGYYGRRRNGGGAFLIGAVCMLAYFVLMLFTLGLSRLREYYADRHSASIVEEGPRKLSEGLAKIVTKTGRMKIRRKREAFAFNSFKTLFISDPDTAESDVAQIAEHDLATSDQALVQKLMSRKVTASTRIMEIFSTHPNITKRLMALQELS